MSTSSSWKPFIKYPTTALRNAGCNPSVQSLTETEQRALLSQILVSYIVSGKEIPDGLEPPKKRKRRAAVD